MQTDISTISWQKFGVAGVLVKAPPYGEWGKKVHLGPPLTTKNKELGQHVSQEILMWPWWLSTARVTPQGLTPRVLCSSTWPSLEGREPLEYMDKMLWIPRKLSFQPPFSERFSIPLLPRILPDKISSLQSDVMLWLMRLSNHEKLMVSDKHALSMYPQQRMVKSTSSLTWYCQGKLMGQFGKPVFSYTGYYQRPLLTSFSRSYLVHSFLPDSMETTPLQILDTPPIGAGGRGRSMSPPPESGWDRDFFDQWQKWQSVIPETKSCTLCLVHSNILSWKLEPLCEKSNCSEATIQWRNSRHM